MKIADLAVKCRLSDRAVRMAVKDLQSLGELSVETHQGGISRYGLSTTPAKSAGVPRQNLPDLPTPAKSAPRQNLPDPPEEPQVSVTPAKSAGVEKTNMLLTVTGSSLAQVKDVPAKPPRDDADRLCEHLANRIAEDGTRRPAVNAKWRDAARLLIDKDGRTEKQVHAAIDWCQDDPFWRGNILSMPKLREKYDQLQKHAMRGRKPTRQPTEADYGDALEIARELDRQEAGE